MTRAGADLVLYAPTRDLTDVAVANPRRKHAPGSLESLYDGNARFLVRTALVRSDEYRRSDNVSLRSPDDVARLCRHLSELDQEHQVVIAVDSKLRLLAIHEAAIGTRSSVSVATADVMKLPLLCSARGVFLVHNHPGGNPLPSEDDAKMTVSVRSSLACIGIEFYDHVIVADSGWYSITHYEKKEWL